MYIRIEAKETYYSVKRDLLMSHVLCISVHITEPAHAAVYHMGILRQALQGTLQQQHDTI